jgi:excisionase family DNA binding protein
VSEHVHVPSLAQFEALQQRVEELERVLAGAAQRWLTVKEAAGYTGRSVKSIHYLLSLDRIPAHKVEGRWRFNAAELDEWMRAQ